MLELLLYLLRNKNKYLYNHSIRVSKLSYKLGQEMGLKEKDLLVLKNGALFHDIGKIIIDNSILNKPGKLNSNEKRIIQNHPLAGVNMFTELNLNKKFIEIIKYHHERWDGNGYPFGLNGEEIPLMARIISIADAFDAMTSVRPYRKKTLSVEEVAEELNSNSERQFDGKIVELFLKG